MTRKKAVIVNDTRPEHHFGCLAVMEALIVLLARRGIDIIHFHPVGVPWQGDAAFLAQAAQADIVIVNGEGSIRHANARAQSLAQVGALCRDTLGIPAVLLNATLDRNNGVIFDMLRAFDLIYVRDQASLRELESRQFAPIGYAPDLSMFHGFVTGRRDAGEGGQRRIGVTDSVLKPVADQLAAFRKSGKLVANSILYDPAETPPPTIYAYDRKMASLDLLVTGRYHSVCFALNAGTPFVALESNTRKISFLLDDIFGSDRRMGEADSLPKLDIGAYCGWTSEEWDALERFKVTRKQGYAALGDAIAALLS